MSGRVYICALIAFAACRDAGTMTIHLVEPCTSTAAEQIAVYLVRGTCTAPLDCGLHEFRCEDTNCIDLCGGYCTPEDVTNLSVVPPDADTPFSLIVSYRYPGATTDQGLLCYNLHVLPDETGANTVELTSANGDRDECCMGSGS